MSNYNFNKLQIAMGDLRNNNKAYALKDIKKELNKFFRDSKCDGVIYTDNNDGMFFGMCVIPILDRRQTASVFSSKPMRFDKYIVEIDSKLLTPTLDVTDVELVAIILHEVGHIVNNTIATQKISDQINYYIAKEGVKIDYTEAMKNDSILNIGIFRALRKLTSIFERKDEEYIADQFVVDCGFGKELESAYDKIIKNRDNLSQKNKEQDTFITLIWSLSLYKSMSNRHNTVKKQLEEARLGEPSNLFKDLYSRTIRRMNDMVYKDSVNQIVMTESAEILRENSFMKQMKRRKMKEIDDELYEYAIRIKMIDSNQEALDILRSINMRINMIQEYIDKYDLNQQEFKRYISVQNKYKKLRQEIIETDTFDPQQHGLYIKYPKIQV